MLIYCQNAVDLTLLSWNTLLGLRTFTTAICLFYRQNCFHWVKFHCWFCTRPSFLAIPWCQKKKLLFSVSKACVCVCDCTSVSDWVSVRVSVWNGRVRATWKRSSPWDFASASDVGEISHVCTLERTRDDSRNRTLDFPLPLCFVVVPPPWALVDCLPSNCYPLFHSPCHWEPQASPPDQPWARSRETETDER